MGNFQDEQNSASEQAEIIIEEDGLREDYTKIPNTILKRADISPGAKLAYVMLLSYAHKVDRCFPGQRRLAEDLGVAVRSVIRYMQELVKAALLRVKRRGLGMTNVYYLTRWSRSKRADDPSASDADPNDISTQGGDDKLSLPQMPNRHREKNKTEKNKISNAVQENIMEEGRRRTWSGLSTIGAILARRQEHRAPVDRRRWLAQEMIEATGDQKGMGCFLRIAAGCPESLIFESLSLLKEAGRSGQVRLRKGALFVGIVRRLCSERGLPEPFEDSSTTDTRARKSVFEYHPSPS